MLIQAETVRGIIVVFLGFGGMAIVALLSYSIYSLMTAKKPDDKEDDNVFD